jgi:hypothetical protein
MSFYDYLIWWINEQRAHYTSLYSIFGQNLQVVASKQDNVFDSHLVLFYESLSKNASEYLNKSIDKVCELNHVSKRQSVYALSVIVNLFVAHSDFMASRPKNRGELETIFLTDVSTIHQAKWQEGAFYGDWIIIHLKGSPKPVFTINQLVRFWKNHGQQMLLNIRVQETEDRYGIPIDFEVKSDSDEKACVKVSQDFSHWSVKGKNYRFNKRQLKVMAALYSEWQNGTNANLTENYILKDVLESPNRKLYDSFRIHPARGNLFVIKNGHVSLIIPEGTEIRVTPKIKGI